MRDGGILAIAQEAPWYRAFLHPVVDALGALSPSASILDLGTGPGKLLEVLAERRSYDLVGADADPGALRVAARRPALADVSLTTTTPGAPLPFENGRFDAVVLCSVLFLQNHPERLAAEALRVVSSTGRIVVLTPTGAGKRGQALRNLPGGLRRNWTMPIWHAATASRARWWQRHHPLIEFARRHGLHHERQTVFFGMATVESLRKAPTIRERTDGSVRR